MTKHGRMWAIGAAWVLLLLTLPSRAGELGDLVKSGDVLAVISALDNGADVNELDGVTPLYIAAESGNAELTKLLIDRGADVNLTVKLQRTPLYAAIKGGFAEIVKLLIENGANPNQPAKSQSPLHLAADNGCLPCVISLVEAGAEVNALISNGSPPIHFAKRNGFDDIVAYLQEHGAGPPPTPPISAFLATADVQSGKDTFDGICVTCHLGAPGVHNPKRHNLWGIVGREKATEIDTHYSPALMEVGGTWTYEDLNAFIVHPAFTVPGTDMSIAGLAEEQQRADLIAYLRTLSDSPLPLPDK